MKFGTLFIALYWICWFAEAQKPNILWLTIEDTSPHFIGCYGDTTARTPVIDKLAADGVQFMNAFSTGTVCSPSRFTLITGVRTYEAGTGNHRSQYPVPHYIKGFPYYMKEQGYYLTNNRKTDYNLADEKQFTRETWHESSANAGWWDRKPGQPFFAVMNFESSHQSRTMTNTYDWYQENVLAQLSADEQVGEKDFAMPPFYRDSEEMRKQFARVYNSIALTDKQIGAVIERLRKDGLMDSTIIFFFSDHGEGIPRGKTNGINLGHRVPFVIWFPPMYRHLSPWPIGSRTDELITFEDLVATMVHFAGATVPAHQKGRVFLGPGRKNPADDVVLSSDRSDNGIDMVRSITDGRYFYARNFMPYLPEARYIRYMEIGEIKQIQRRDLAAKRLNDVQAQMFSPRPAEFLFDLSRDPWELENLANDPGMQSVLERMRTKLKGHILERRDVMFLPEYEIREISKNTTPYEYRMNPAGYPLEEIYEAASLSGFRGREHAKRQMELLKHPNKIVRYWAVTGLRSQEKSLLKKFRKELTATLQDTYAPVAIVASAISYDVFGDRIARDKLMMYCKDKDASLVLMTLHFILYLDKPEPFVPAAQEIFADASAPYEVSAAAKDILGRLGYIPNGWETR